MQFCKLPKAEQLERFIRHSEDRETEKVIRRSVTRPKQEISTQMLPQYSMPCSGRRRDNLDQLLCRSLGFNAR